MELLRQTGLDKLIEAALAEDIGHGDVTTAALVEPTQPGRARIVVKAAQVVFCGGPLVEPAMRLSGAEPTITYLAAEAALVGRGEKVAEIEGRLAGLLAGERTLLNFLQLMSGIATLTRRYVEAVAGTRARIIDTRKTHPLLRALEKYAVRAGGGANHRFGLDSGVLIKENHIAAAQSIGAALERARKLVPHTLRIEIECETIEQVSEAVASGADLILLDNMSLEQIRSARKIAAEPIALEASGGVTLDTVRLIAECGVDFISVGALTHSAPAADLSMRVVAA